MLHSGSKGIAAEVRSALNSNAESSLEVTPIGAYKAPEVRMTHRDSTIMKALEELPNGLVGVVRLVGRRNVLLRDPRLMKFIGPSQHQSVQ
jgi:hypothetical protein